MKARQTLLYGPGVHVDFAHKETPKQKTKNAKINIQPLIPAFWTVKVVFGCPLKDSNQSDKMYKTPTTPPSPHGSKKKLTI